MAQIGTILIMILAAIAAALVQMAISRTREYAAEAAGAETCGHPLWLMSALDKLEEGAAVIENEEAEANPATAHMFIFNPLRGGSTQGRMTAEQNSFRRWRCLTTIGYESGDIWEMSANQPTHADQKHREEPR